MSKNPVTLTPQTSLDDAASIMRKHHFRRFPVVENGKLVGFVNDCDMMRVAPSPATTLSKYEMRSLLSKLKVEEIMQKKVHNVRDDATIEEAALIMYNHEVSALPVVSEVGALVGIITDTDVFKTFVDVMDLEGGKTRLTIEVADKVGVVNEVSGIFAKNGLSIDSLVTCKEPNGIFQIVVRGNIPDIPKLKQEIASAGFKVIHDERCDVTFS